MTKIHQTYYLNLSAKNVKILRTIAFLFRLKQLLQFTTVLLLLKRHTLNKMFSVSTERPELRKICQYKNLVEIQRSIISFLLNSPVIDYSHSKELFFFLIILL